MGFEVTDRVRSDPTRLRTEIDQLRTEIRRISTKALRALVNTHASRHLPGGDDPITSVAVTGDAVVDTGSVTLTTTFQDGASLSFTMPSGWNTARIVARGSALFDIAGAITGLMEARVEIGASDGTTAQYDSQLTGDNTMGAAHQAVVSGNATVAIAVRKTDSGDNAITRTHDLSYIAMRVS